VQRLFAAIENPFALNQFHKLLIGKERAPHHRLHIDQNHVVVALVPLPYERLERFNARRVDHGHVAHAQEHIGFHQLHVLVDLLLENAHRPKEEGPVQCVDADVIAQMDIIALQHYIHFVVDVVLLEPFKMKQLGQLYKEQQDGQQHANLNRNHQIDNHCEQECDEQHARFLRADTKNALDLCNIDHAK